MPAVLPPLASLETYRARRDFSQTPEPAAMHGKRTAGPLRFVIQKHAARSLHYDFRLELGGVLLSWAVPKGPSLDPADKRMAVRTEDHPLSYAVFEGSIPRGAYGAGTVIVWDCGSWQPVGDARAGLAQGKLAFVLRGHKLAGLWELVRMRNPQGSRQQPWLLFKKRDAQARPRAEFDVLQALPDSVLRAPAAAAPAPEPAPVALPATLSPQLATLATEVPAGDWVCELKFDGYRLLARIEHGKARLFTRNGHDWTDKLPALAVDLGRLGLASAWLDGEVVAVNAQGVPDFNLLQQAFDDAATQALRYVAFDLLHLDGQDLRERGLRERRALLEPLIAAHPSERLRFSADLGADAAGALRAACEMQLEGIVAKQASAPYRSARTRSWLKLKCQQRQEFVVGGFTLRAGSDNEVGSLLLGVYDKAGHLRPVGGVGAGWDAAGARALHKRLSVMAVKVSPFDGGAAGAKTARKRGAAAAPHWVAPQLVVEVNFGGWTSAGQVRHAVYAGTRQDKPALQVVREEAEAEAKAKAKVKAEAAAPKRAVPALSHPGRVIDPASGLTKLDLARYYAQVATRMLPHLKGRPVALLRAPTGVNGSTFFQKHAGQSAIPGIKPLDAALWPGHEALIVAATPQALQGAAQMNVIEFHTWNCTAAHINKPDRIVFDLDPGAGVAWPLVQEGALLVRALLQQLGLQAWLKTSGGKGLHVVVPIAARWPVATVKAFSQALVRHLAHAIPARFVAISGPARRVGKIYVDYLRNGPGATTVAAFSARARPGLGVSMPLAWEALDGLKGGDHWTVASALDHLSFEKQDPWAAYFKTRQSIGPGLKALGVGPVPEAPG